MNKYLKISLAAAVVFISFGLKSPAEALTGAVYTTDLDCVGTDVNIYTSKGAVYLDGGPHNTQHGSGLPDGHYYVKVTEPDGILLGTSIGSGTDQPITVTNGSFDHCYQLSAILVKASDNTAAGYDTTSNAGGEYKVWVSSSPSFTDSDSKTDNFKVQPDTTPTPSPSPVNEIDGTKFNDANVNHKFDTGESGIAGWTISLTGPVTTTVQTDSNGNYSFPNLPDGTYTVCEVAQTGWGQTFPTTGSICSDGSLGYGISVSGGEVVQNINFGNTQNAIWTVIKHVVNDNGGSAVAGDFSFYSNNGTSTTGPVSIVQDSVNPLLGETDVVVPAGTYTVTEAGEVNGQLNGYAVSYQNCANVTINPGTQADCVVTNDDIPAHLIVIKHVINNNTGTKQASDFTTTITGVTTANQSAPGAEAPGVDNVLTSIGSYSVDEGAHDGYVKTLSTDCSGTIALGETKTCTITNNDFGTWDVRKVLINDNGGTATIPQFAFVVNGDTAHPFYFSNATDGLVQIPVPPDAQVYVKEFTHNGYTSTVSTGCGSADNLITVDDNSHADCTITNNDIPPVLTLNKVVINDNGGTAQPNAWTLTATGPTNLSGSTGVTSDSSFSAGTYSLSEANGPAGYAPSDWSCVVNGGQPVSGSSLTLHLADVATCTITNNDIPPKLTLVKVVDNTNGGTADKTAWTLTASGTSPIFGAGGATSGDTFQAGTYTLSESKGPNYYVAGTWSCAGDVTNTGPSIVMGIGQTATCTITNTYTPPTRTLGFWSTHTQYTNSIFSADYPSGMPIGTAPHKGIITNTQTKGQSQLYGAYFASIPYLSGGKTKRTATDQARMILLQQLVTAKLNCQTFGCSTTIQNLITQADSDYAAGNSQLTADASALDAFNNSRDNVNIVGNTGNATQSTSQGLANKAFWDQP